METVLWTVDAKRPDPQVMARAGRIIRDGGLVAFPTETVYGLGANALDGAAVRRIFKAKGRPADNPLIVHVGAVRDLDGVAAGTGPVADKLIRRFWPGPLTLVLPKRAGIPAEVTAGLDTVGVRMPAHPVALHLVRTAGAPIAAPSANASGRPSPTRAEHVWADLAGRVELILDGGPAPVGLESTVLDVTGSRPVVLRPGGVTVEQLEEVLQVEIMVSGEEGEIPRSPGMKYTHYAPRAALLLIDGPYAAVSEEIRRRARALDQSGRRVAVLARTESAADYAGLNTVLCGSRADPAAVAAGLYAALRDCDAAGADVILAEGVEPRGVGRAVMNRLRKAAKEVIEVRTTV